MLDQSRSGLSPGRLSPMGLFGGGRKRREDRVWARFEALEPGMERKGLWIQAWEPMEDDGTPPMEGVLLLTPRALFWAPHMGGVKRYALANVRDVMIDPPPWIFGLAVAGEGAEPELVGWWLELPWDAGKRIPQKKLFVAVLISHLERHRMPRTPLTP